MINSSKIGCNSNLQQRFQKHVLYQNVSFQKGVARFWYWYLSQNKHHHFNLLIVRQTLNKLACNLTILVIDLKKMNLGIIFNHPSMTLPKLFMIVSWNSVSSFWWTLSTDFLRWVRREFTVLTTDGPESNDHVCHTNGILLFSSVGSVRLLANSFPSRQRHYFWHGINHSSSDLWYIRGMFIKMSQEQLNYIICILRLDKAEQKTILLYTYNSAKKPHEMLMQDIPWLKKVKFLEYVQQSYLVPITDDCLDAY